MRERIKNFFTRKRKGSSVYVESAFVTFFMAAFLTGCVYSYTLWITKYTVKETVDFAMTTAMKKMETISSSEYDTVLQYTEDTLLDFGIEVDDITWSSSAPSGTEPNYSDQITIEFKGSYDFANDTKAKPIANSLKSLSDLFGNETLFKMNLEKKVEGTKKC